MTCFQFLLELQPKSSCFQRRTYSKPISPRATAKSNKSSASPGGAIGPERWLLEIFAPTLNDLCEGKRQQNELRNRGDPDSQLLSGFDSSTDARRDFK